MIEKLQVGTSKNVQMIDITRQVNEKIQASGIMSGLCTVYIPHTTAGITINENADPDVVRDMTTALNKLVPFEDGYHHFEGNSAAHIKSSMMGFSQQLIIDQGRLVLGTWQGLYFCEFDGPRTRQVIVKIMSD